MTQYGFRIMILFLILSTSPIPAQDFDSLVREGESLYRDGKFGESAGSFEKAFAIGEPDMSHYYNAACSWALSGDRDAAFRNLEKSIEKGWIDTTWVKEDPDLKSLHDDARWQNVMTTVRGKLGDFEKSLPDVHNELEIVKLPEPRVEGEISIEQTLLGRRSVRSYSDRPLTLREISQLLWAAYGITERKDSPAFLRGGFKTAPSAGGLYPLEIYVATGNVTGLPGGVYLYKPKGHELARIAIGDRRKELRDAGLGQPMIEEAPAVIVYSAVFARTTGKYGKRGRERYVWMDAGHSAQNIYLQAQAMDIGVCVSGAFNDILVKNVVGMTKQEEPVYIIPVGKRK